MTNCRISHTCDATIGFYAGHQGPQTVEHIRSAANNSYVATLLVTSDSRHST